MRWRPDFGDCHVKYHRMTGETELNISVIQTISEPSSICLFVYVLLQLWIH